MTLKKLFFIVLATSAIISSSLSAVTIVQILSQQERYDQEEEVIKEKVNQCIKLLSNEEATSDLGDLNEEFQVKGSRFKNNYTPLLWAIDNGDYSEEIPNLIELLIKKGADVKKRVDDSLLEGSLLYFVCISPGQHFLEIAKILIDSGAEKPETKVISIVSSLCIQKGIPTKTRDQAHKLAALLRKKFSWSDDEIEKIESLISRNILELTEIKVCSKGLFSENEETWCW